MVTEIVPMGAPGPGMGDAADDLGRGPLISPMIIPPVICGYLLRMACRTFDKNRLGRVARAGGRLPESPESLCSVAYPICRTRYRDRRGS